MSHRVLLMLAFLALLAGAVFVSRGDAQPDSFREVAKGVWFRHGDVEGKGHCNNVVIELADSLLVVDANFPSGAEALVKDIKKVSSKPVKWVFDTHHHGDHAYANAYWTSLGATTWAHENVVKEMERYEPKRWKETKRDDVVALKRDTAEPPRKTFGKSPYVIEEGGRRVEFHHFGWAHTRGDGFVYLPKEKILCTGDAVTNGPYNFPADGNVENWPRVIEAAQKLDVVQVLPGHGPAGGKEVLEGQKQFMIELRKAAAKGTKANDPLFASVKLPENVKTWVGRGLAGQLQTAYKEIEAKKPAGDLPH
jgi:cyclase